MKKLLGYLSVGLLSHHLWAASQVGVLWQLTSPHFPPSQLFAAYHTEDTRALKMLSQLTPYLEKADRVAFEMLKDIPTLRTLAAQFLSTDDRGLDAIILPPLYPEVEKILQVTHRLSPFLIKQLQPWAVITLLNAPPTQTGIYADWQLYKQVMDLGKAPVPLEKVEEHVHMESILPLDEQITLIARGIQEFAEVSAVNRQWVEFYLKGDLHAIADILWERHPVYTVEPAVKLKLQREMQRRNQILVQRMKPLLEAGNALFIVNALRLGGNVGILKLLQEAGYELSAEKDILQ